MGGYIDYTRKLSWPCGHGLVDVHKAAALGLGNGRVDT